MWEPTIKCYGTMPGIVLRVDGKGRITLPKEFREKYDIRPGSRVMVEARGRGELVVKVVERDPSEQLGQLLGDFEFTRKNKSAGREALAEGDGLTKLLVETDFSL